MQGLVASPDGTRVLKATSHGKADNAQSIGGQVAQDLLAQGAGTIIQACLSGQA